MSAEPLVTFVVRARNAEATLERCLRSVQEQTRPARVVVVDNRSTDATVAIARAHGALVVDRGPLPFNYGRAINRGMEQVRTPYAAILSSHCWLRDPRHVEVVEELFGDPTVAGLGGGLRAPTGELLTGPHRQERLVLAPGYGFSNHSSAVRTAVWRQFPFTEELPASEELDWVGRVTAAGHAVVIDPRLHVPNGHRRAQGLTALHRRALREGWAAGALGLEPAERLPYLSRVLSEVPAHRRWALPLYLVHVPRLVEVHGFVSGALQGRAHRRGDPSRLPPPA
ncbi:glycosyltransferase [Quadrisphaera sp. KR29]|uniref:glycosyltransferase n=1 Tax=Quadrisphaera sp. KR29 TaxID=3461391 RepID=UPI004044A591